MHALAVAPRGRKPVDEPDPHAPLTGATLADRIKNARLRAGLKKASLAAACEVSWATVNNWEKGTSTPGLANLEAVAAATGFGVEQLSGSSGGEAAMPPALERALEIYSRAGELTPLQIRQITELRFAGGPPTEPTRYIRIMEDMLGGPGEPIRDDVDAKARALGVKKTRPRKKS